MASDQIAASLSDRLSNAWLHCLKKVGLSGLKDIACVIKDGTFTADYLTKMSMELTGSMYKKGKLDGLSFWDLLRQKRVDLIREYYLATVNIPLIRFSPGLKVRFGIDELSDVNCLTPQYEAVLFSIEKEYYKTALYKNPDNMAELKYYVEIRPSGIPAFLSRFDKSKITIYPQYNNYIRADSIDGFLAGIDAFAPLPETY